MKPEPAVTIDGYSQALGADRTRLLDIAEQLQHGFGYVGDDAVEAIATGLGMHAVEVE
jgi:NADH:ubiquinone oxidoreductase subunit E